MMKRGLDRTFGEKAFLTFGSFIMVVFAMACVYPILLVIGSSFTEEITLLRNGYQIIPAKFSLFAYQIVLSGNSAMLRAYMISAIVTVVGTAAAVTAGVMIAYALSRRDFRLRHFFNLYVVFTLLFNAGLVPWYIVNVTIWHLKNTLAALILPNMVNSFNILLLCNFMRTVPEEIIESARIDGASEFRIASSIVVPIAMPAIATVGLFFAMNYWNDWFLAQLYLDNAPQLYPIQFLLRTIVVNAQFLTQNSATLSIMGGNTLPTEGVKMAACVLAIGPLIIVYPFVQRFFVRGLTLGAIKG
jgi:putative aldouronate transport system permease protein